MANGKDDRLGKVALGITGVALAAGAVAAGLALRNPKTRTNLRRKIDKSDMYQAIQHRIRMGRKGKRRNVIS